eukprot:1137218-Pelagomonas_calceolata.AAC.3
MDMGDDFKRDLSMHALLSAACGQMLTQGYFDREGTFGISKGSAHGNRWMVFVTLQVKLWVHGAQAGITVRREVPYLNAEKQSVALSSMNCLLRVLPTHECKAFYEDCSTIEYEVSTEGASYT